MTLTSTPAGEAVARLLLLREELLRPSAGHLLTEPDFVDHAPWRHRESDGGRRDAPADSRGF